MAFCFFGMAVSLLVTIPLFFIKGSRFSPIGYFLLAALNGAAGFVMAYFYVIGSWMGLLVNGIPVAIVWIANILIYSLWQRSALAALLSLISPLAAYIVLVALLGQPHNGALVCSLAIVSSILDIALIAIYAVYRLKGEEDDALSGASA